jgi:PAS domain S-box-containing protein
MGALSRDDEFTLFELLPIGAYRSLPDGRQIRANPALVRLNGYASEAELLAGVQDIGREWYVQSGRREEFKRLLETTGRVTAFVSEIYRHHSRERIWISENAHVVRNAEGDVLYYEGTVEDITAQKRAQDALAQSEAQLRLFSSQMPAMAYRVRFEPDGRRTYLYVSEGVQALYGLSPQEVMADPLLLLRMRHPEDADRDVARTNALIQRGEPLLTEFRIVPRGGGVRWVQVRSQVVARDGQASIRSGVMLDISEQKAAQAALARQADLWKRVLEAVGDGVWDWNLATGEEQISDRCFEMYGYTRADFTGRASDLDERTHPDDRAQMQRDREAHFGGEAPLYSNEHRIRCADGSWKWVLSRGVVIERGPQGQALRMIGTHTDISERREAETLRQQRDAAAAADRTKTALLSRVSHELRTPLNAVLGFGQLLELDTSLGPQHQQKVAMVLDAGRHLLGLVDDLLDLAAAESGQIKLQLGAVNLHDTLASAWNWLAARGAQAGVSLLGGEHLLSLPPVHADARRLRQILGNLLSNAIKYNRPGGHISVAARVTAQDVAIDVSDTGPGLSAEQLQRVFLPFERLGAERSAVQGSGLGLALSRQFAQAMGGDLTVHSVPGEGSTFSLRLPRVPG